MSLIKGFILELDDERIEWIKTQLGDPDADESTVGWSDYEAKFYEHRFSQTTEEEFVWFSNQTSDSLHAKFCTEINMLRDIISHNNIAAGLEEPIYKMAYAHAVTLLETFLSDTVKSLIVNNDYYFKNALNNVDEFKKAKFLLADVWKHPEGVKGLAIETLSEVLYHNIPKVKLILESIVAVKLTLDMTEVNIITVKRHDIVHRNGKSTAGTVVELDADIVANAIAHLEKFATDLCQQLEDLPF